LTYYQKQDVQRALSKIMGDNHNNKFQEDQQNCVYQLGFYVISKTITISSGFRIPKNAVIQVLHYNIAKDCIVVRFDDKEFEMNRSEESVEQQQGAMKNMMTRKFFPLINSFARTAHMVQSSTVPELIKFGIVNTCVGSGNDASLMYTMLGRAEQARQIQLLHPLRKQDFSVNEAALKFDELYMGISAIVPLDKTIGIDGKTEIICKS
jgi:hypothetical protein